MTFFQKTFVRIQLSGEFHSTDSNVCGFFSDALDVFVQQRMDNLVSVILSLHNCVQRLQQCIRIHAFNL